MDFSHLKINCTRLPKIFAGNSLGISESEKERIVTLQTKEETKGELTPNEYERLDFLLDKEKYSELHTVGKGARAYLLFLYALKKYGKAAKIQTDYNGEPSAQNGILKENYVIDLLEDNTGIKIYRSKVRIKNDFLLGIPDAFDDEDWTKSKIVHEIKTTSNRILFLNRKVYPVTISNYLQAQGYMALTGKKKAVIHHSLVDYAEKIISDQRARMFNYFCPDGYETSRFLEAWRIKEGQLRFSDMKPSERVFSCFFDRDEKLIQKIYKKVQVCRDWLDTYSELDKEIESSGTSIIQKNSFSALRRKLGLE